MYRQLPRSGHAQTWRIFDGVSAFSGVIEAVSSFVYMKMAKESK